MKRFHAPAMNSDEFRVVRALEKARPELVEPFLREVAGARRDVMLRLLSAMLREDSRGLFSRLRADGDVAYIPLRGGRLTFRVAAVHAFRRFEVGDVRFVSESGEAGIPAVPDLVRVLEDGSNLAWDGLERELENGAANLALARAYRGKYSESGAPDLLELAGRKDPALFFERMCVEGHNLHPSAKTKLGMEPEAVLRHAPEMDGAANLRLAAIRRDLALSSDMGGEGFDATFLRILPDVRREAEARLSGMGLRPAEYALVPVHPWQFEKVVPEVYSREILDRAIVPIPDVSIPAFSTSSFRTVVLLGADLAVKTSVSCQMTSTVRTISPQTALNAPEFSRVMEEIMAREPGLSETFVPIRELAGISFDGDTEEKRRSLSAVIREGIGKFCMPGELPVIGCALYAESPATGRSVLSETIEAYRDSTNSPSLEYAARGFVREYASITLPGFLTLMSAYGVGLEGHLQNSVPIFREGRPVRLLVRDWGGARVHAGRLRKSGIKASFAPDSLTLTKSLDEMRRKVSYTVFQNHLGEVILGASKHSGVPEHTLWREVRRVCEEVFESLSARTEIAERLVSDRAVLFAPTVHHKALATMRLRPEVVGDIYAEVPNPMHAPCGDSDASS